MSKRVVTVGGVHIGAGSPVTIQSMCSVPFSRFDELASQALRLQEEGCDILRVSVPDRESADRFAELKSILKIPLVADIHYDAELAISSIRAGADKIRINPGNMPEPDIRRIAQEAKSRGVPIRVGVNGGSLEKDLLKKYGSPCAQALAESADRNVKRLEECGFEDIVVSIKTSNVPIMVSAYRLFETKYNPKSYPLHLGVTEAGTLRTGTIKSAAGIGALLLDGIGDTIRVSLAADPAEEVAAAKSLLRALGLRKGGLEVVSCPTCGRTTVNSIELADRIEKEFADVQTPIRIAVMGCPVNGIGEAAESDFGVTGANGRYVLFKKGKIIKDISPDKIFDVIRAEIDNVIHNRNTKNE